MCMSIITLLLCSPMSCKGTFHAIVQKALYGVLGSCKDQEVRFLTTRTLVSILRKLRMCTKWQTEMHK
jgi:hypothetical protein